MKFSKECSSPKIQNLPKIDICKLNVRFQPKYPQLSRSASICSIKVSDLGKFLKEKVDLKARNSAF